jgi:hypothetical protein
MQEVQDKTTAAGDSRRIERAVAVFGTWMITGLFLDGWAHEAEKPETFFSPWHGILYSGFAAAVVWFAWDGMRARKAGEQQPDFDRLMTVGLVVFIVGAIGDGLWHEIFGIEVDLEALVSPSHLALFFGGFLMVTAPIRIAGDRPDAGWAQCVTVALATALIGFFTQYLSPFEGVGGFRFPDRFVRELLEIHGVAGVLVFNLLFSAAVLYALARWRPPVGFATLLYGGVALGMAGLEGFAAVELALPALVAGAVVDLLIARGLKPWAVVTGGSLVLWCGFFLAADLSYGLAWSVELWTGTIVLACASSVLLAAAMNRPAAR